MVLTDGWGAYNSLPEHGYTRNKTVISASGDPAHVSMPAVHRVASLLKRWLLVTHQGSVSPAHLDAYLSEFTFRFNRRNAGGGASDRRGDGPALTVSRSGLAVSRIGFHGDRVIWQRFWRRSLSSEDVAVQAGVSAAVGVCWFREGGGMPSVTLAPVSGRYLSFADRKEIAILRACGAGVREIARQLGRSPSTISRELRRNAATRGGGWSIAATTAQWHADMRAQRPQAREARREPRAAPLCAGPPVGRGAAP